MGPNKLLGFTCTTLTNNKLYPMKKKSHNKDY